MSEMDGICKRAKESFTSEKKEHLMVCERALVHALFLTRDALNLQIEKYSLYKKLSTQHSMYIHWYT